jgi:hypothetical protein
MRCIVAGMLAGIVLGLAGARTLRARGDSGAPLGTVVTLDTLKSCTPADWKPEKPANRLRSHQFRLARAKGDPDDAVLLILPDLSGPPEQHLERWKGMFEPPAGKTIEDAAKVERFQVGPARVTVLDVQGTYLATDRPLAPKATAKPLPNYRMISAVLQTKDNSFLIRMVGPAPTVALHRAEFGAWLRNFR